MSLIFIAVPTKGVAEAHGVLNEDYLRFFAQLHLYYPDHTFISPMLQDYQLLKYMPDTDATWAVWSRHCKTLIERSDEVWVLQFDGWAESVGVRGEIDHANIHNKPVAYIGIPGVTQ